MCPCQDSTYAYMLALLVWIVKLYACKPGDRTTPIVVMVLILIGRPATMHMCLQMHALLTLLPVVHRHVNALLISLQCPSLLLI